MNPLQEFQKKLKERGIGYAIFFSTSYSNLDPNISYFAKVNAEFCCLILPKKGTPTLITNIMEISRFKKKSPIKNIIAVKRRAELYNTLKKKVASSKKIGLNYSNITLSQFNQLRKEIKNKLWQDINTECADTRKIKTKEEINIISKGCKIADKVFAKTIEHWRDFKTETDVVAFMKHEMAKHQVTESFPTIIASGKNASMPHHNPKGSLQEGFCIMDFGVRYKGYCTDMTRTIFIGSPKIDDLQLYARTLKVQKQAINNSRIGTAASDLVEQVHKDLGIFSKHFTHGLGHGIGIEIHEAPNLKLDNKKELLQENMIMTIEPGVYIENKLGIRIEDDILITKKGPVILSKTTKNLILVRK